MTRLSLLVVGFVVTASSGAWWSISGPITEYPELIPDCTAQVVVVSSPTVCPPPAVSTGPFIMRVSTQPNSDCYALPFIFPNGSLPATKWVPCQ